MYRTLQAQLTEALKAIGEAGTYKQERWMSSSQAAKITVDGHEALNFCANNYLGLANHPDIIAAAKQAMDHWGFGLASVRFICGTQDLHIHLEKRVSTLLGTEGAILFGSCFDANSGLFEALFGPDDAIISDELNHASLIDGIRLSKAARFRYRNRDMRDLELKLQATRKASNRVIVTDGVFSMDGHFAPLNDICDLADEYDALVLVDDSHAVGFVGNGGRGTPDLFGVSDRVDIRTGTFGKALGGASGGYVASHAEIIDMLRQRARPYLFSNTIPPAVVAGTLRAFDLLDEEGARLRSHLRSNTQQFRSRMRHANFEVREGDHPIVPVMFHNALLASRMAEEIQAHGIYVVAFSYPVVPEGAARIRVQLSASHSAQEVDRTVDAFISARAKVEKDRGHAHAAFD